MIAWRHDWLAVPSPILMVLLAPTGAVAASRPGYQYVLSGTGEAGFGHASVVDQGSGGLPMTGLSLLALGVFGCLIIGCGILLARTPGGR